MIRRLYSSLYWWAHRITEKQRMRKRLAELEGRLAKHDSDIESMVHFPEPVRQRMVDYRGKLVDQIEVAKRFV